MPWLTCGHYYSEILTNSNQKHLDGMLGMVNLTNHSSFAAVFVCFFVCTVVFSYCLRVHVWSLGAMQVQVHRTITNEQLVKNVLNFLKKATTKLIKQNCMGIH